MKQINVDDRIILIDDEDENLLIGHSWKFCPYGYLRATIEGERFYLHRFLLKPPKGMVVDHIDGNILNNCKNNLRICTVKQNTINARKVKGNRYSKYKGVTFCSTEKRKKRWVAACESNEKRITIGRYMTEKEAAEAYNKKAYELWGQYAKLNKID